MLRLRVATFNTHGARPVVGPPSVSNICGLLETLDADLIGLQEVHRFLPPPGVTQDQPARYRHHLRRPVTFRRSLGIGKIGYGNALVSRVEPIGARRHLLPSIREQRSVLECVFMIDRSPIVVLNTHFGLDAQERISQASFVSGLMSGDLPTLLLGDLNATPDSPEIQIIEQRRASFWGDLSLPTFPVGAPKVRIDYLAGSRHWECERVDVIATDVSDHYAVSGVVELRG